LPLTVSTNWLPPATALLGEIEVMDGAGSQVPQDTTIASVIASMDTRANLGALAIGLHLRQLADGIERYSGKNGWSVESAGLAEPHNSSARYEDYTHETVTQIAGLRLLTSPSSHP